MGHSETWGVEGTQGYGAWRVRKGMGDGGYARAWGVEGTQEA